MIPKTIHYCWFGRGEKPKLAQKCIESWKRFCPDYEIIEWNEDNFDINKNEYTKMCYNEKRFAFLSDYVRLLVVNEHGGIYFDTDVELLKNPDELLENEAYFGFETDEYINTGVGFGSVAHGEAVEKMVAEYDFLLDGKNGTVGCPILNTKALVSLGLCQNGKRQTVAGAEIYPADYFNPYESTTGRLNKTDSTVSVHWYSGMWMSKSQQLRSKITKPLHRIFGVDFFSKFHK
ncbi:MAG: glycosyl transferase [Clostridia bacterium]|nr:glycosyl transferase [Clostridia bacterium]